MKKNSLKNRNINIFASVDKMPYVQSRDIALRYITNDPDRELHPIQHVHLS